MSSVLFYNGSSSQLTWNANETPGNLGAGQSASVPVGTVAIGAIVSFTGDAYLAGPGIDIGNNSYELAGFDDGATPSGPANGNPQVTSAVFAILNGTSSTVTWKVWNTNEPTVSGTLKSLGVEFPTVDRTTNWLGFAGLQDCSVVLALLPSGVGGPMITWLTALPPGQTSDAALELARKAIARTE